VVTQAVMQECLANLARVKGHQPRHRAFRRRCRPRLHSRAAPGHHGRPADCREGARRTRCRAHRCGSEVVQRGAKAGGGPPRTACRHRQPRGTTWNAPGRPSRAGWMLGNAARSLDAGAAGAAVAPISRPPAAYRTETCPPRWSSPGRSAGSTSFPLPGSTPGSRGRLGHGGPEGPADRRWWRTRGRTSTPRALHRGTGAIEAINVHFPAWELDEGRARVATHRASRLPHP
jgi:hypothetical protein